MTEFQYSNALPFLPDLAGHLVLVGAGKMGGALLDGWLALGLGADRIAVLDPQASAEIVAHEAQGLRVNPAIGGLTAKAVVIAVKPQVAADVLPTLASLVAPDTLIISIMAGRNLDFLAHAFPRDTPIVRSMPNTPASIGRGITVAVANEHVSQPQRELADTLLAATGSVEWVTDEALIDAVTAVSGSGPAYVFFLAESLAKAGVSAGLPADLAMKLARETVAGSGELLHRSPLAPATLRQNVTSPGGTTAAALAVLMAPDGLDPVMQKAVAAAAQRSRELAG